MSKKIIQFPIYPESVHGFYFRVLIYPTRKMMYRGVKSRGSVPDDGMRGMVQHLRHKKQLGYINLCRGHLDAEILSHESAHATLAWATAMKVNPLDRAVDEGEITTMAVDCGEERFAYALGRVVGQLSLAAWEYHLVTAPEQ